MSFKLVQGVLREDEIKLAALYCSKLLSSQDFRENIMPYFGNSSTNKNLVRVERFAEDFQRETGIPIIERCREFIKPYCSGDVVLFKDKINFRHPGSPGFGAHQDAAAGWDKYSSSFISIAIFIRQSNSEHGGFEFAVGEKFDNFIPNINGQISNESFELFRRESISAKEGDGIVFDSYAPHRSHQNNSSHVVQHFIFTFFSGNDTQVREQYYLDKSNSMSKIDGQYSFRVFEFDTKLQK